MMDGATFVFAGVALVIGVGIGLALGRRKGSDVAAAPAPTATPSAPPPPVVLREANADAALQVLGILQREARFVDFLEEDVSKFSDAEIGAAARVVHTGAKKALHEHFVLKPVRTEPEGSKVTLPKGFAAAEVKVTGNVHGEPPFAGTLQHRGWKVTEVKLPRLSAEHDAKVVAPAEVEL
ncbi:MAG: DUF2760 domain-containing protein [Polyangiales bacterium]|nr:DUF2760 domain-containing protein [Myxococcales bacterium]